MLLRPFLRLLPVSEVLNLARDFCTSSSFISRLENRFSLEHILARLKESGTRLDTHVVDEIVTKVDIAAGIGRPLEQGLIGANCTKVLEEVESLRGGPSTVSAGVANACSPLRPLRWPFVPLTSCVYQAGDGLRQGVDTIGEGEEGNANEAEADGGDAQVSGEGSSEEDDNDCGQTTQVQVPAVARNKRWEEVNAPRIVCGKKRSHL